MVRFHFIEFSFLFSIISTIRVTYSRARAFDPILIECSFFLARNSYKFLTLDRNFEYLTKQTSSHLILFSIHTIDVSNAVYFIIVDDHRPLSSVFCFVFFLCLLTVVYVCCCPRTSHVVPSSLRKLYFYFQFLVFCFVLRVASSKRGWRAKMTTDSRVLLLLKTSVKTRKLYIYLYTPGGHNLFIINNFMTAYNFVCLFSLYHYPRICKESSS